MEALPGPFLQLVRHRPLKPLHPRDASPVDSGNLVGNLLVLRSGLLELIDAPVLPPRLFAGLRDTANGCGLTRPAVLPGPEEREPVPGFPSTSVLKIERLEAEFKSRPYDADRRRDPAPSGWRLATAEIKAYAFTATRQVQWWVHALGTFVPRASRRYLGRRPNGLWLAAPPEPRWRRLPRTGSPSEPNCNRCGARLDGRT